MAKADLIKEYKDLTGNDLDESLTVKEIEAELDKVKSEEPVKSGSYVAAQPFNDALNKGTSYKVGDPIKEMDQTTLQTRLDRKLIKEA